MTCDPKCTSRMKAGKETETQCLLLICQPAELPRGSVKLEGRRGSIPKRAPLLPCRQTRLLRRRQKFIFQLLPEPYPRAHVQTPRPTCGGRRTERRVSLSCFLPAMSYSSLQSM